MGKELEDYDSDAGPKIRLHFLKDGNQEKFISDLGEFRATSLIFPPLKTYDGLPLLSNVK